MKKIYPSRYRTYWLLVTLKLPLMVIVVPVQPVPQRSVALNVPVMGEPTAPIAIVIVPFVPWYVLGTSE